jgi:hypothetical protein
MQSRRCNLTTSLERDLKKIARRESSFVFKPFDAKISWTLGCELHRLAELLEASVMIELSLHDRQFFHQAMPVSNGKQPRLGATQTQHRLGLPQKFLRDRSKIRTRGLGLHWCDHRFCFATTRGSHACVLAQHLGQNLADLALEEPA